MTLPISPVWALATLAGLSFPRKGSAAAFLRRQITRAQNQESRTHLFPTEAAARLGVSTKTLERWTQRGILIPRLRTTGQHRRYALADIERLRMNAAQQAQPNIRCPHCGKNFGSKVQLKEHGQRKTTKRGPASRPERRSPSQKEAGQNARLARDLPRARKKAAR